ncbi:MAG: CPBP family intramembrane metalloprotease [Oscillospiraceae bacterium]|nr:CPBP family intramembrane metalloprotease [Oscillospiraceae bacterium]
MEQFNEQHLLRKHLRRCFRPVSWSLVGYYALMNIVVVAAAFVSGTTEGEGWGYLIATVLGLLILLIWKKPRFWADEIFAKGKPMKAGAFFGILCVFLGAQSVYQTLTTSIEVFLNSYGFTMMEGLEAMAPDPSSFSMFLYAGIAAPIAEEIIFRGFIQRTLLPYGKKFAILGSAFTFGIFHGNLMQTPYAFLVGLILGYVALEYNIGWAMVLHMINNLVIADMLTRLTMGLDPMVSGIIVTVIIGLFAIGAVVVLIRKWKDIRAYASSEKLSGDYLHSFFVSGGMITLMVLMLINIIMSLFMIITPFYY